MTEDMTVGMTVGMTDGMVALKFILDTMIPDPDFVAGILRRVDDEVCRLDDAMERDWLARNK